LAVLHGSFCDRSRRGREFQKRSARFVEFTVVSASEEDVPRLWVPPATWRCTRAWTRSCRTGFAARQAGQL